MGTTPALDSATISVDEAARFLGIGRNSAYAAVARGEIPSIRIGKLILVPTAPLRAMVGVEPSEATKGEAS